MNEMLEKLGQNAKDAETVLRNLSTNDKNKTLEAVAKAAGIAIEDTMAFGDGGNDIPILKRAGTGVAMGNALDNVKDAADYVTADIDDDGVAKALEHFGV